MGAIMAQNEVITALYEMLAKSDPKAATSGKPYADFRQAMTTFLTAIGSAGEELDATIGKGRSDGG